MRAGEGGAIETILNVMRTHINNAGVCEAGCGALRNITYIIGNFFMPLFNFQNHFFNSIAENKVRAGEGGAIETILNAIRMHINNAGVCKDGCGALWIIVVDGKTKQIYKSKNGI